MLLDLKFNEKIYFQASELDLLSAGVPQTEIDLVKSNSQKELLLSLRQAAYKAESDPLYMEWQFDQTAESEQAWRDKVAEIKARYPLTDES